MRGTMIQVAGGDLPSEPVEVESCTITADRVADFLRRSAPPGFADESASVIAPISYILAMRREHGPGIEISPQAFAIHGGHDLALHDELRIGETYRMLSSIDRAFGKTGRAGPMTIVERTVKILNSTDELAAEIRDRQVVRWRPRPGTEAMQSPTSPSPIPDGAPAIDQTAESFAIERLEDFEVGSEIGPFHVRALAPGEISEWAASLRERETLFHDQAGARNLGYADLVVPGPMQSAYIDRLLSACMPAWRAVHVGMTFRQSLLAGEPFKIQGVIVDTAAERLTCEVMIRSCRSGETTATGSLIFQPR